MTFILCDREVDVALGAVVVFIKVGAVTAETAARTAPNAKPMDMAPITYIATSTFDPIRAVAVNLLGVPRQPDTASVALESET